MGAALSRALILERLPFYFSKALKSVSDSVTDGILASVVKGIGKATGVVGTSNLALINATLRIGYPECPMDSKIRVNDCVAGLNQLDLLIVAQLMAERLITTKKASAGGGVPTPGPPSSEKGAVGAASVVLHGPVVDRATARLLDIVASEDRYRKLLFRSDALAPGIGKNPDKKDARTELKALLQATFRASVASSAKGRYGDVSEYRLTSSWQNSLKHIEDKKVFVPTADGSAYRLPTVGDETDLRLEIPEEGLAYLRNLTFQYPTTTFFSSNGINLLTPEAQTAA